MVLQKKDVQDIRKNGYKNFNFCDINGILRISLVDKVKNQLQGDMCEPGINVRRYLEGIGPYEYEGRQLWVIRLSKDKFQELLEPRPDLNSDGHIMSRCKYDRMYIGYFPD